MSCAGAEPSIQAFVDGELSGVDREQFQRHVDTCETCARSCRLQARFKAAIRAHLPPSPLPPDLRRRLRAALDAEPPAALRWPWLTYPRLVPAAAAMLLLLGVTATVRRTQSQVVQQAQRSYQAEMPMDVVGSD